jgi:hypothetical protein
VGHKYSLILSREITDEESVILRDAGCACAVFTTDTLPTNAEVTVTRLDFDDTESPSLAEAIEAGLEAVKKVPELTVPGLTVPAVPKAQADSDTVIEGTVVDSTVVDSTVVDSTVVDGTVVDGTVVEATVAENTEEAPEPKKPAAKRTTTRKTSTKKPAKTAETVGAGATSE